MRAFLERLRPFAPIPLRAALAAVFCIYGGKLVLWDIGAFQTLVAGWGLPRWAGTAGAWTTLVGGALLGVGFMTRLAALACAVITGAILFKTKLDTGWQGGLDLPVAALAGCLSLLCSGAGRLSIDRRLFG